METKSPLKSLGILGPLAGLVIFAVNWKFPGLGLTEAEVSGLIDQVALIAGALLGIYGRWRATTRIG